MQRYEIEVYRTEIGTVPFREWFDNIKDKKAQTQLLARLDRAALGNFGDWKMLTGTAGICEMRIHSGQGWRIFYAVVGQTIVLLLAGSTKKEQEKTITKAKTYLEDYHRRVNNDPSKRTF